MFARLPDWLLLTYMAALGASIGSFLNVVIARLPEERSLIRPGSRCPRCEQSIRWYDNIPIVSFIGLWGRCRHCKTPISARYPLVEALMACLAMACGMRFGWSFELALWLLVSAALLAIIFLDIDHWWVPDVITFPGMLLAALVSFLPGGIDPLGALWGLLPALGLYLIGRVFYWLTGREGMGLGDIKLLAMVGLLLGVVDTLGVLILASLQGTVVGVVLRLTGGHRDAAARAADGSDASASSDDEPSLAAPQAAADGGTGSSEDDEDDEDDWQPHPHAFPFGPFLALATYQVVLLPEIFAALPAQLTRALAELVR